FFYCCGYLLVLHSFPTRRSSDLGLPLKIAAKVDRADRDYWEDVIRPLVANNPNVEYIGEICERQKSEFLGNALALLFPIDWPERSEEHTSELQSRENLVCRLLLE